MKMEKQFKTITKKITIESKPANVWHVFINPSITKAMGGEYVSDWKRGGTIGWKGKDGNMYTHGEILEINPANVLKHNLKDLNNPTQMLSVITYRFEEAGGSTILHAEEELNYNVTDEELEEISEGWDFALEAIKDIAEKL
jgi:uncharacterized protein YndB with AHSA1/START domain